MDELDALRRFRAPLAIVDEDARARVAARLATSPRLVAGHARRRRAALVAVIVAGLLVIAAISGAASGALSLVGVTDDAGSAMPASGTNPPPAYVLGTELHDSLGQVHQLSVAAGATNSLTDAVTSPSGQVVYTAGGQTKTPSLRIFDPATGSDALVDANGSLPAWRSDGTLAYVRNDTQGATYQTIVEVRASPTAAPTPWTATGVYWPLAWAGDTLIVAKLDSGATPVLEAYTAPGVFRELAQGALVAISPDGTQLLIADHAALDGIPSSPNLQLLDLASGKVGSTLDLRDVTPSGLETGVTLPGGPGDWLGDRIVYPAPAGLVELTATGGELALAKVARFTGDQGLRGAEYHEARFADASGDHAIVKAIVLPPSGKGGEMLPSALVCDLASDQCTRGAVASDPNEPITLLFNESRPTG